MYEAQLKRKNLLLPNDISSNSIKNINDFFIEGTDDIIHRLALKQNIMIKFKTSPM